jgi:hypothetical protein
MLENVPILILNNYDISEKKNLLNLNIVWIWIRFKDIVLTSATQNTRRIFVDHLSCSETSERTVIYTYLAYCDRSTL